MQPWQATYFSLDWYISSFVGLLRNVATLNWIYQSCTLVKKRGYFPLEKHCSPKSTESKHIWPLCLGNRLRSRAEHYIPHLCYTEQQRVGKGLFRVKGVKGRQRIGYGTGQEAEPEWSDAEKLLNWQFKKKWESENQ